MKYGFLVFIMGLVFILGCAAGLPHKAESTLQQTALLQPLINAGISKTELDSLTVLIKTNAPFDAIQNRINLFWNNRYQKLSDEEKVIYVNLADSTQRIEYLSCKNDWERRLFLRRLNKEQKEKLLQTEEGRIFYYSFKLVASNQELKEYLNLPDSLKESWLYTFWKKKDPNPTTEENEFKIEFDRRVEYVLYNFWVPFGQQRPWDDRGDVYILYGEPEEIERVGTRLNRAAFAWDLIDPADAQVWHYWTKHISLQLEDARNIGIWALNAYKERDDEKPREAVLDFLKTASEKVGLARVEYVPDLGSPLDFPWNWWRFWNQGDYYNVRINLSVPLGKLGLLVDSTKGDSGSPPSGFAPRRVGEAEGWLCFEERIVITDQNRKTIASDSVWVRKKISKYLDRKDLLWADQYSCDSLAPGFYTIAVSVKDSAGKRIGIYQDTSVILVSHVKLKASEKISQLVMADSVWEADSTYLERNGAKFVRNGLVIKPRPGNVYSSGQSPSFYCEIYELKKGPVASPLGEEVDKSITTATPGLAPRRDDSLRCRIYYYFLKKDSKTGKFELYQGPFTEEASYPSSPLNRSGSGQVQPYIKGTLSPDKFPQGEYIIRIDVYDLNDPKAKEDQIRKTVVGFKIG